MIGKCKSSGAGLSKYLLDEKKHKEVEIVERNNLFSDNAKDVIRIKSVLKEYLID